MSIYEVKRTTKHTFSSLGRHFNVMALWISAGTHSLVFHVPFKPPQSCPTRTVSAVIPVFAVAIDMICSETHFDSVYPVPMATSGSMAVSGIGLLSC